MALGTANKLVLAFVTLIIGVVLIGSIATQGLINTQKTNVADEAISISSLRADDNSNSINTSAANFTVTNNPTSWKSDDCPLTNFVYGNASDNYTVTTDYVIDLSKGILQVLNTTAPREGGNDTLADYTYCPDTYMNLTWGRTAVNLVAGFFAIAILLISVGLFYSVAKDVGII